MDENGYEYLVTLFTSNSLWESELAEYFNNDKKIKKAIRGASGKALVRYTWPGKYLLVTRYL